MTAEERRTKTQCMKRTTHVRNLGGTFRKPLGKQFCQDNLKFSSPSGESRNVPNDYLSNKTSLENWKLVLSFRSVRVYSNSVNRPCTQIRSGLPTPNPPDKGCMGAVAKLM